MVERTSSLRHAALEARSDLGSTGAEVIERLHPGRLIRRTARSAVVLLLVMSGGLAVLVVFRRILAP